MPTFTLSVIYQHLIVEILQWTLLLFSIRHILQDQVYEILNTFIPY